MKYACPVCGYGELDRRPADFTICPSCGTEFELDDEIRTHDELRQAWLRAGAPWYSETVRPPTGWNEYRIERLVAFALGDADGTPAPYVEFSHHAISDSYALA